METPQENLDVIATEIKDGFTSGKVDHDVDSDEDQAIIFTVWKLELTTWSED